MATLYDPDGTSRRVDPATPPHFSLSELQRLVDGWIEVVSLADERLIMVVNEEGKIHDLPLNKEATKISGLLPHDYIVGPALVCSRDQLDTEGD